MTNKEAIEVIKMLFHDSTNEDYPFTEQFGTACKLAVEALEQTEWIPFTFDEDGLNCPLPEEGEEFLISNGNWVDIDEMNCDIYEDRIMWFLDSGREFDGLAWQPLPKPYKKGTTNE